MSAWLRNLAPRTLAAQLMLLTAGAVLLSNVAVAAWFTITHDRIAEEATMERVLDRSVSAAILLDSILPDQRARAARTMSSGPWRFDLHERRPPLARMNGLESALAGHVRAMLPAETAQGPLTVRILPPPPEQLAHHRRRPPSQVVEIILPIAHGGWLVTNFDLQGGMPWPAPFFYAVFVAVLSASLAAAFAARRVALPLSKLADAATAVARGGEAPRVPETGPKDVRSAAEAFNAMTGQVRRVMESQRQLLAAVGHDLRTPITAMRISAEFISEEEVRENIEKNLAELQTLTEAVLSAARGAGWEKRRRIDLAALVESLCTDLEDLGRPIEFTPHPPLPLLCRPDELRRAVRNLLENALTYGTRAQVRMSETADRVTIVVEDDGPGIPQADLARVFEPFVRLEDSRSSETGGAGLGLTLVKTIVEGHGGDIYLENRTEGGLRAVLRLPRDSETS